MKLKTYTKGMLAIAAAGLMMSCSSNDTDVEMDKPLDPKQESYALAFVSAFGQPDPNNDWGFEKKDLLEYNADGTPAAQTRGANPNTNQYGKYYDTPSPLTEAQKEVVRKWFQTHKNPNGTSVIWKDFFVQQVYKGGTKLSGANADCQEVYTVKDRNNNTKTIVGSDHMNFLYCASNGKEHINNFNNGTFSGGNAHKVLQNDGSRKEDMISLMLDCPTKDGFGFHDSYSDGYHDVYSYVIIPGDVIDESVAGMYFVGFDYTTIKTSEGINLPGNGYFSDWIVKITECTKKGTKRIICEDLGNIGDFDYNDVVFDAAVYKENGKVKADVKLLAAGGTMPIYIQDSSNEIHALFHIPVTSTVNLAPNYTEKDPVFFTVTVAEQVDNNHEYSIDDVKIISGNITLRAAKGSAPEKIGVSKSFNWTSEGESIFSKYPDFIKYVKDNTVAWY